MALWARGRGVALAAASAAAIGVFAAGAAAQELVADKTGGVPFDLWGFNHTRDGGMARSCTRTGDSEERACVVVFCRGDGAYWLGLAPTSDVGLFDNQEGAVAFGDDRRQVSWALVEGPEPGKPLWVSDLEDLNDFFQKLTTRGTLRLSLGAEDGVAYDFTMASSQLALNLLRVRCERVSNRTGAAPSGD